jgi:hypothetical protein
MGCKIIILVFCIRRIKMLKKHWKPIAIVLIGVLLCAVAYGIKGKERGEKSSPDEATKSGEVERQITEADVPAAALAAFKKMAAGAKFTEFAEEIEHGHTFYEGSWKSPAGENVDVLVTPTGDVVEIEEIVSADQVPAAVLAMAQKAAGKDVQLAFEKKTTIIYEVKFQKGSKQHELLLTPDARRVEEGVQKNKGKENEERKIKPSQETFNPNIYLIISNKEIEVKTSDNGKLLSRKVEKDDDDEDNDDEENNDGEED